MNASTAQFVRKELRSLTPLYAAAAVLVSIALIRIFFFDLKTAYSMVVLYASYFVAALAGAITFTGEKASGTFQFLSALPVERGRLFLVKTLHTLVVVPAMCISVLPGVYSLVVFGGVEIKAAILCFTALAWFYCFGLLFSVLMNAVIIATLAGITSTFLAGISMAAFSHYLYNLNKAPILSLVLACAIPIAAVWLARRLFCGRRGQIGI